MSKGVLTTSNGVITSNGVQATGSGLAQSYDCVRPDPRAQGVTNTMQPRDIFDESDILAEELLAAIDLPLVDDSPKVRTSNVASSLALEHWHSARVLLRSGLLSSALVVHRAQFEALARSVWLAYAASDEHVSKLTATLSQESEQAAKNMPQIAEMMQELAKKAPPQAYDALSRFKENTWKALNSYAHAGIHPIRRHHDGYPVKLLHDVLRNTNGIAVMTCMQAVVLSGQQPLQRILLEIAGKHPACMHPPL
jgi:hypothetical protein